MQAQDIKDLDESTLNLIGFSLKAKTNGKIVNLSLKLERERGQEVIQELEDIKKLIGDMDFTALHSEENVDTETELGQWLYVNEILEEASISIPLLSETFERVVLNAHEKFALSQEKAKEMSKLSGTDVEKLLQTYKEQQKLKVTESAAIVTKAMQNLPSVSINRETPHEFDTKFKESIMSAKRNAVQYSRSIEDTTTSLIILNSYLEEAA